MKNVMSLLEETCQSTPERLESFIPEGPDEEGGNEQNSDRGRSTASVIRADHLRDKIEAHAVVTSPSPNHSETYGGSHSVRDALRDIATWRILHKLSEISHQVAYLSHRLNAKGVRARHDIVPKVAGYDCRGGGQPSDSFRHHGCAR